MFNKNRNEKKYIIKNPEGILYVLPINGQIPYMASLCLHGKWKISHEDNRDTNNSLYRKGFTISVSKNNYKRDIEICFGLSVPRNFSVPKYNVLSVKKINIKSGQVATIITKNEHNVKNKICWIRLINGDGYGNDVFLTVSSTLNKECADLYEQEIDHIFHLMSIMPING